MAPKKQPPVAKKQPTSKSGPTNWDDLLETMNSSSSGPFFFVKAPRTRIRLACFSDDQREFYAEATTVFKGREKSKFVVFGVVLSTEGHGAKPLGDQWKEKVIPIVITKTTLKGIISLLAEGYELFSPKEGYGITINKSGTGTDTDYNVNPSPNPVPCNFAKMEQPEKTLQDYAEELTARSQQRGEKGSSGFKSNGRNQPEEEAGDDW